MTAVGAQRRHRRTVIALGLAVAVLGTSVVGARAWSVTADSRKRVQESEARQLDLYRWLADRDAILESQRRVYVDRLRKLEAQVREREQDVAVLRARLPVQRPVGVAGPVD